ncbi:MAG: hypothetical protein QOI29_1804 [Mycobacterium sp.]|jgi:hypothetical protein|nr:hypothetical protein [Mycobacterium sp.]
MGRRGIAALAIVLAAFVGSAVAHADSGVVTARATVNGQDIAAIDTTAPLRLEPNGTADIAVELTNGSSEAISVKKVAFAGEVLGLRYFNYVAATALTVEPGATGKLSVQLDLADLVGEATGLMRGDLKVSDAAGNVIAVVPTELDIRGSWWSVSGVLALALIVFTALALADLAFAISRRRLPANRWQRSLRYLLPGIGIGLMLGFTTPVLRWWTPTVGVWVVAAGIIAAVCLALGYFSPSRGDVDEDDDVDDLDYLGDDGETVNLGSGDATEDLGYDDATKDLGYDDATENLVDDDVTNQLDDEEDDATVTVSKAGAHAAGESGP